MGKSSETLLVDDNDVGHFFNNCGLTIYNIVCQCYFSQWQVNGGHVIK